MPSIGLLWSRIPQTGIGWKGYLKTLLTSFFRRNTDISNLGTLSKSHHNDHAYSASLVTTGMEMITIEASVCAPLPQTPVELCAKAMSTASKGEMRWPADTPLPP
jgi:hypothetical protein